MQESCLNLYHHPQQDTLANHLVHELSQQNTSFFQRSTVVVQTRGMANWLRQRIAQHNNICMQVDFPLPTKFMRQTLARFGVSDNVMLDSDTLLWHIFTLLPELMEKKTFRSLKEYVSPKLQIGEQRLFQLANNIADLFDSYFVYRGNMLKEWLDKPDLLLTDDALWQRELFHRLIDRNSHFLPWEEIFKYLKKKKKTPSALPDRIYFFGITNFPPNYIDFLAQLSKHIPVHLYWQNPVFASEGYWEDAPTKRNWILKQDEADQDPPANPLLASFGKLGREFISNLYTGSFDELNWHNYQLENEPTKKTTTLGLIQQDIHNNEHQPNKQTAELNKKDETLTIHSAHTAVREIEILQNYLLKELHKNPDLDLQDILIFCPDIETYSPAIESVFGSVPYDSPTFIPYRICDRTSPTNEPIIRFCLQLLDFYNSRCSSQDILELFSFEHFANPVGVQSSDLNNLAHLIRSSGIRWGLNQEHVESITPTKLLAEHTWERGLERLLLGYSMTAKKEDPLWQNTLAHSDIESDNVNLVSALCQTIELITEIKNTLQQRQSVPEWAAWLRNVLASNLSPHALESSGYHRIVQTLESISEQAKEANFNDSVHALTFIERLTDLLTKSFPKGHFLSGNLTFCELKPMRSVPSEIICIIGLNYDSFPRRQHNISFDLIKKEPKIGDRSSRDDDTYSFLEALLSAKKSLYLSYLGHSVKDNQPRPPATPLQTLLDSYPALQQQIKRHPLHGHAAEYFQQDNPISYQQSQLETAQLLQQENRQQKSKPSFNKINEIKKSDKKEQIEVIKLEDFVNTFVKSSQSFLNLRLNAKTTWLETPISEHELFELNNLERYKTLKKIEQLDSTINPKILQHLLSQQDALPPHSIGRHILAQLLEAQDYFTNNLQPVHEETINLRIEKWQIQGQLAVISSSPNTLQTSQYTKEPKSNNLLTLGIQRAILALHLNQSTLSHLHAYDFSKKNKPPKIHEHSTTPEQARHYLKTLLKKYEQSLYQPLCHFPNTSKEYFKALHLKKNASFNQKTRDYLAKEQAFTKGWQSSYFTIGEQEKIENQLLYDLNNPFNEDFSQLAIDLWKPLT